MMVSRPAIIALIAVGSLLVHGSAAAADFTITQKNKKFSVSQITIKTGDRITFVNDDTVNHNVFSDAKGAEVDFLQRPGRSDTVQFTQPGTFELECALHPEMKLEVRVRP
jgi:plastocyanin